MPAEYAEEMERLASVATAYRMVPPTTSVVSAEVTVPLASIPVLVRQPAKTASNFPSADGAELERMERASIPPREQAALILLGSPRTALLLLIRLFSSREFLLVLLQRSR